MLNPYHVTYTYFQTFWRHLNKSTKYTVTLYPNRQIKFHCSTLFYQPRGQNVRNYGEYFYCYRSEYCYNRSWSTSVPLRHVRALIIPHCQVILLRIILVILLTPDIVISALIYVIVLTFLAAALALISLLLGFVVFYVDWCINIATTPRRLHDETFFLELDPTDKCEIFC